MDLYQPCLVATTNNYLNLKGHGKTYGKILFDEPLLNLVDRLIGYQRETY